MAASAQNARRSALDQQRDRLRGLYRTRGIEHLAQYCPARELGGKVEPGMRRDSSRAAPDR